MAKHLKDKTDAECRSLAGHYYVRATKAERSRDESLKRLLVVEAENDRLRGLAIEMTRSDVNGLSS